MAVPAESLQGDTSLNYFWPAWHAICCLLDAVFDILAIYAYFSGASNPDALCRFVYRDDEVPKYEVCMRDQSLLYTIAGVTAAAFFIIGCVAHGVCSYQHSRSCLAFMRGMLLLGLPLQAYRAQKYKREGKTEDYEVADRYIRCHRLVEMATEVPQTCLSVFVFVFSIKLRRVGGLWLTDPSSSSVQRLLLLMNSVVGVTSCSFACSDYLVSGTKSLWSWPPLGSTTYKTVLVWIAFIACGASMTSHALVYVLLASSFKVYLLLLLLVWFIGGFIAYGSCSRQALPSLGHAYLTVLLSFPGYAGRRDSSQKCRGWAWIPAVSLALLFSAGALSIAFTQIITHWFTIQFDDDLLWKDERMPMWKLPEFKSEPIPVPFDFAAQFYFKQQRGVHGGGDATSSLFGLILLIAASLEVLAFVSACVLIRRRQDN